MSLDIMNVFKDFVSTTTTSTTTTSIDEKRHAMRNKCRLIKCSVSTQLSFFPRKMQILRIQNTIYKQTSINEHFLVSPYSSMAELLSNLVAIRHMWRQL
jgi:hypothetical protein